MGTEVKTEKQDGSGQEEFQTQLIEQRLLEIQNKRNYFRIKGERRKLDAILNGNGRVLFDAVRHLVLPVITLAYVWWAGMVRIMRSSMLETLRQDYVTTARAKGLPEKVVQNRHARRNALLPVTTIAGLIAAQLMGGLVIAEMIFDYHGLGQFAARAAQNLDFPAVLGFALYFAVILVFTNLIVDLLYAALDPRVKLG